MTFKKRLFISDANWNNPRCGCRRPPSERPPRGCNRTPTASQHPVLEGCRRPSGERPKWGCNRQLQQGFASGSTGFDGCRRPLSERPPWGCNRKWKQEAAAKGSGFDGCRRPPCERPPWARCNLGMYVPSSNMREYIGPSSYGWGGY